MITTQRNNQNETNLKTSPQFPHIPLVYFRVDDEFQEVMQFNNDMMELYGTRLYELDGSDMKACLYEMLQQFPQIKVIFMGQRLTDPHGPYLTPVQRSDIDKGWPAVDRANSILSWSYTQVWNFLLDFQLPYCKLYELGFSSLGSIDRSLPNPYLRKLRTRFASLTFPIKYNIMLSSKSN
eukprot:UN01792